MIRLLLPLFLLPAVAVARPHARLADARLQLRGGHPDVALRWAEEVAAESADLRRDAHLLAASAEEALDRPGDAVRRLAALWDDDPAPVVRWRLARATALTGAPVRARRIARPLQRAADDDLAQRARVARAAWRLQARPMLGAWRALGRVLDSVPDDQVVDVQADAHARRLDVAVREAAEASLEGPPARQVSALRERIAWLEHADREARALVELREAIPLLHGLVALGEGWRDLADDLSTAPPPRRLSPAQAVAYRQGLRDRARGLLRRARDAFEAAARVGEQQRLRHDSELATHLRISLEAIDARLAAYVPGSDTNRPPGRSAP